jgi:hypothetical protein
MNLQLHRLCDRMARANHLNTRGLRSFRHEFARAYKVQRALVEQAVSGYVGKPFNAENRESIIADLLIAFPPEPVTNIVQSVSTDVDGMTTVTLTPELSALIGQIQAHGQ